MLLMLNNRLRNEKEDDIPRFCDLVDPRNRQSKEEPKTAVEVKSQIKSKMKRMFSKKEVD